MPQALLFPAVPDNPAAFRTLVANGTEPHTATGLAILIAVASRHCDFVSVREVVAVRNINMSRSAGFFVWYFGGFCSGRIQSLGTGEDGKGICPLRQLHFYTSNMMEPQVKSHGSVCTRRTKIYPQRSSLC